MDDLDALTDILTGDNFSFIANFFPKSDAAGYYRPLIGLSYQLDKSLWFLDGRAMHVESVIAHIINCILLYFIASKAVRRYEINDAFYLPMFVALLFGVHPIVTESVNWISGRTDIMMSMFVLSSVLLLFFYIESGKKWQLFLSLLSAFVSLLAKEAAFGYLIIIPVLLLNSSGHSMRPEHRASPVAFCLFFSTALLAAIFLNSFWLVVAIALVYLIYLWRSIQGIKWSEIFKYVFAGVVLVSSSILLFWVIRSVVFASSVGKIANTVKLMGDDLNYTISLFLGATGFYVKKFFIPVPLNFFILEIDPLYDLLGIAVLFLVMYLLVLRTLPALFALAGFAVMLPVLPFAFGTIAWTAYAERYIYVSSAFWMLALLLGIWKTIEETARARMYGYAILSCLCILASYVTLHRNIQWMTNATLMKDTVRQSPKVRKLRDMYIAALVSAGSFSEAEKEYSYLIKELPPNHELNRSDIIIGRMLIRQKRYEEALKLYQESITRTRYVSEPLLENAVSLIDEMETGGIVNLLDKYSLDKLRVEYSSHLYKISKNPRLFVTAAKTAMNRGEYDAAYSSFGRALEFIPLQDINQRKHLTHLRDKMKEKLNGTH